jgi:hypothetical protein
MGTLGPGRLQTTPRRAGPAAGPPARGAAARRPVATPKLALLTVAARSPLAALRAAGRMKCTPSMPARRAGLRARWRGGGGWREATIGGERRFMRKGKPSIGRWWMGHGH